MDFIGFGFFPSKKLFVGKEEILLSDLSQFLVTHTNLNFLGLVLTEACKDEMFTDENHPDYSTQIGKEAF